jgi:hypothetical protein
MRLSTDISDSNSKAGKPTNVSLVSQNDSLGSKPSPTSAQRNKSKIKVKKKLVNKEKDLRSSISKVENVKAALQMQS